MQPRPEFEPAYVGCYGFVWRRLASYRVANPDRLPRRLVRLLNLVTRIEWDVCPTEAAAIHRDGGIHLRTLSHVQSGGKGLVGG